MNPAPKRVLLVGSAISGVPIPDTPRQTAGHPRVPGVPAVKKAVLGAISKAVSAGARPPSEIGKILRELHDSKSPHGYLFNAMAYEALVELIWKTDTHAALRLMASCRCKKPNLNHLAIAEGLRNGRWSAVYTTNFDELIEIALQAQTGSTDAQLDYWLFAENQTVHPSVIWECPKTKVRVVKLHGTISNVVTKEDLGSLVCRYQDVAKDLPDKVQLMMKSDFRDAEISVVGYSGSDLDIRLPLLNASKPGKVAGFQWFERPRSSGPDLVELSRQDARDGLLNAVKGRQLITNLASSSPEENFLLQGCESNQLARLVTKFLPERRHQNAVAYLGALRPPAALELLARILDSCGSPAIGVVVRRLLESGARRGRPLRYLVAQSHAHSHSWREYIEFSENHRHQLGIHPLEEDAQLAFIWQMSCGDEPLRCLEQHSALAASITAYAKSRRNTEKDFPFLFANHILIHFCNRVLRTVPASDYAREMVGPILEVLAPDSSVCFGPRVVLKRAQWLAAKYKEAGFLARSFDAEREQLLAKTRIGRRSLRRYESIQQDFFDLEQRYSVMGLETGSVCVLRDLARWAYDNRSFQDCIEFAGKSCRRAMQIPGHKADLEKGYKLILDASEQALKRLRRTHKSVI